MHTHAIQYTDVAADCSVTCDKGFEDENVSEIENNVLRLSTVSRSCMTVSLHFEYHLSPAASF